MQFILVVTFVFCVHIFSCLKRKLCLAFSYAASGKASDLSCYFLLIRYDPTTGIFTVPSGGDGLYYFSTYLLVNFGEFGEFNIRVNGEILCSARGDNNNSGSNDNAVATCSGLAQLTEGRLYTIPWKRFFLKHVAKYSQHMISHV